jgi:hypothetical protein
MANFTNPNFDTDLSGWIAGKSPADLPTDLGMWYEADKISGLTDGDSIVTFPDSGPNGNTLTPSGTAPIYKTGIINGLPVVRFGDNGRLHKSSPVVGEPSGNSAQTIFSIFRPNAQQDADIIFNFGAGSSNTGTHFIYRASTGFWSWDRWGFSNEAHFDALNNGTPYIMAGRKPSSTRTVYTSGKEGGSNGSAMNLVPAGVTLGDIDTSAGIFLDGDIAEFVSWYGALSLADFADVHSYLALKYGLTLTERGGNITRDTGIKYGGAASAKTIALTDTPLYEKVNAGNTSRQFLTAYAYTDGSPVTSTDVELFYDDSALLPTYTNMGGG